MIVSFACNDPDNGVFAGRASGCHFDNLGGDMVEFDHDDFIDGCAFSIDDVMLKFKVGNAAFPYMRRINWYGNWCWDGFVMKRPQGIRLLQYLNRKRDDWHCTGGAVRILDWLDRRAAVAAAAKG